MTTPAEVRARIVALVRRDLVGPLPPDIVANDADLERERLAEAPSGWYLTGFIAPADASERPKLADESEDAVPALDEHEEGETTSGSLLEEESADETGGASGDEGEPEAPVVRRRFAPSSIGLTVLVPEEVDRVAVRVTWGDYVTEPPLTEAQLTDESAETPRVDWVRQPADCTVEIPVPDSGPARPKLVPGSAAPGRPGGGLELVAHARPFTLNLPGEASRRVRALSVFLVNRRKPARRCQRRSDYVSARRRKSVPRGGWGLST
jgi:hypothetical protein